MRKDLTGHIGPDGQIERIPDGLGEAHQDKEVQNTVY